ncbi:MAG: carbohydrate binding domain-containing protein [Clostridia bacterium]|nr:carbohydrate binding domain-containing protein [Clostridia bacterium]
MKKVWSVLLVLAMVLSCLSTISLLAGAEGEGEWSENLFAGETSTFDPTFQSYEIGATPEGISGEGSPTLTIAAEDALKFSAAYSHQSPQIADTKALVAAAAGTEKDVTVFYSIDVFMVGDSGKPGYGQIENAFGTVVRNATSTGGWSRVAAVVSTVDEWVTSSGEITIPAAAFADETQTFDFMLDSLGRKVGYVCNPQVRIKNEDGTYGENLVTNGLDAFTMFSSATDLGVEAVGSNQFLNVKSPYRWSAPLFAGKTLIRDYTAGKDWKSVEVEFSADVRIPENTTIRPYIRAYDANNGHKALSESVTGTGDWVTLTGTMSVTAEEIAADPVWNFTFDEISSKDFDVDNVVLRVRKEAEPTVSAEPTPAYAQLVNGDAESGTTGWMAFTNGKVTQVTPGANGTAHAIEYSDPASKWGSIGFDLGPAIIQDKEAGYNGAGAGTYKITFWAKAAEGKGGKFNFLLNSKWHKMSSDIRKLGGDYANAQHGTLLPVDSLEMTDQWQKYEFEFEVPQTFLDQLVKLYHDSSVDTPDIYKLLLRLDGSVSGGAWADGNTFSYRVDEVELKVPQGSSRPSGDAFPVAMVAVLSVAVAVSVFVTVRKKREE